MSWRKRWASRWVREPIGGAGAMLLLRRIWCARFPDLAGDLRAASGQNEAQILISIDQAEELFGTADKAEAATFMQVLNAMQDPSLPFLVVLAMRSDYLGELQKAPV